MNKFLRRIGAMWMLMAISMPAWALEPNGEGVYEIGSVDDLKAFAELVNGGETAISAVLTADITIDDDNLIISPTSSQTFRGEFDGQGHTITFDNVEWSSPNSAATDATGLFGHLAGNVSNLRLEGVINAKGIRMAPLAGRLEDSSIIKNIISNVTIKHSVGGDSACSGIVSRPSAGSSQIINCIFTGGIVSSDENAPTASNVGGLVGWNPDNVITTIKNSAVVALIQVAPSSATTPTDIIGRCSASNGPIKLENVFYLLKDENMNVERIWEPSTQIQAEDVASGALCFGLNGDQSEISWYQKVGEDAFPSLDPSRGQVYLNGRAHCDGTPYDEAFYSNTNEGFTQDDHNFVDGVCSVCGTADPDFVTVGEDGYYNIGAAGQFVWFASKVNSGFPDLKARLTAPIDLDGVVWKPIGTVASPFTGEFDGQLYPITNINNMLFGTISGAQITRVALESGEITATSTADAAHTGSIVGHSTTKEGSITNSYSKVAMNGGSGDLGGIAGKYLGTLKNVAFIGSFSGTLETWSLGGLAGSTNSTNTTFINDCFVAAEWGEGLDPAYGARGGIVGWCHTNTPTNCYVIADTFTKLLGDGTGSTEMCEFRAADDFTDGAVAWALNGESISDVSWYQTLSDDATQSDPYPTVDPTHEIVYPTAYGYASAGADNFNEMRSSLIEAEITYCDNAVGYIGFRDVYRDALIQMQSITDRDQFIEAYNSAKTLRADVEKSVKAYADYSAYVQNILKIADESSIGGDDMEFLRDYLDNEWEPGEDYPNGSYPYIMLYCQLPDDMLADEKAYVESLWLTAQKNGYKVGDDITSMLVNDNFSNGFNGWTYTKNGSTFTTGGVPEVMPTAEAWNATFDLKQTITGLTDGYYKLQVNASYRPAGNIYSTNYAAWTYLNDDETLVMTESEDVIREEDAVDLVNCYINGGAIYDENGSHISPYDYEYSDFDNEIYGYVPLGPLSCSYAFNAGRYVNTIVTEVKDGTLTVGLKLPGSGLETDWLGFGNFRLTYLGDANTEYTTAAYDETLAGMVARSNTLLAYVGSTGADYRAYPEFSATLRAELGDEIAAVADATTTEEKQALVARFAETFRNIYDCKKSYANYFDSVSSLYEAGYAMAENDTTLLGLLVKYQSTLVDVIAVKWANGAYSKEEAEEMADMKATELYQYLYSNIPHMVDGKYQISNADELKTFAMLVNSGQTGANAVLTADIEAYPDQPMIGITEAMAYRGSFDGQGHTLTLNWTGAHALTSDPAGLFAYLAGPVSNLRLEGTIEAMSPRTGALTGRIVAAVTISNVISNVTMIGHYAGDAALSGLLGRPSVAGIVVKNCMYTGTMISDVSVNVGGLIGWNATTTTMINCAMLGTIKVKNLRSSYGLTNVDSNLLGRASGTLTAQNCYYLPGRLTAEDIQEGYVEVTGVLTGSSAVTEDQVKNGELCYKLNGDQSDIAWYQTLGSDEHPVLDNTHLVVYLKDDGTYYNIIDGIEMASMEKNRALVNVYDMQGRAIRTGVKAKDALQGLPSGLYIIGGKKVLK